MHMMFAPFAGADGQRGLASRFRQLLARPRATQAAVALGAALCLLVFVATRIAGSIPAPKAGAKLQYYSPRGPQPANRSASCAAVMRSLITSKPADVWPPPCAPPADLRLAYQGPDGAMPFSDETRCMAQRYEGHAVLKWSTEYIDNMRDALSSRKDPGTYDWADVDQVAQVLHKYGSGVKGKLGMVMGTEKPWVEALALEAGAAAVWTFEYAEIHSEHSQVIAVLPRDVAHSFIDGKLPQFDFVATYSSLEHSGLGRYGDSLNPDGDKEAVQQARCMLKPGGLLFLGLPMSCRGDGNGETVWNAHRIYGWKRLFYIASGLELVGMSDATCTAGLMHGIAVFRKAYDDS